MALLHQRVAAQLRRRGGVVRRLRGRQMRGSVPFSEAGALERVNMRQQVLGPAAESPLRPAARSLAHLPRAAKDSVSNKQAHNQQPAGRTSFL